MSNRIEAETSEWKIRTYYLASLLASHLGNSDRDVYALHSVQDAILMVNGAETPNPALFNNDTALAALIETRDRLEKEE